MANIRRVFEQPPPTRTPGKRKASLAHRGLTPERRATVLAQLRLTGMYVDAARALGASVETITRWRKENPDFEEECKAASAEVDARIGLKARLCLELELDKVASGYRPPRQQLTAAGEVVETLDAPYQNNYMVRMGLTKLDPEYTHPKQKIEVSEAEKVESAADAAAARLAKFDKEKTQVYIGEDGVKVTTNIPKTRKRRRRRRRR